MAHLTDMEELLAKIPSADIRDYMREAMNCYMSGAYRGALVLSYIALFDDLLAKLGELGNVNATAKAIYQDASKKKTDQDVYESYLIDQLSSKNLISGLDASFLTTLRTLRNKSAHPSGHKPSPEEARFIFYETISRFLSQPILSTTQLVDELVARLKNSNVFPVSTLTEVMVVVADETKSLHDEAMPQLVVKLAAAVASTDATTSQNASLFLIGLAGTDRPAANSAIQSKLLTAKADSADYAEVLTPVLSANGKLMLGLNGATVGRLRAVIADKIASLTGTLSESKLVHPTNTLSSIATSMPEAQFAVDFKAELEALFEKRAHSEFVVKLVASKPTLLPIYFPKLVAKAGSSDYGTANTLANSIDTLDPSLSALLSDEQSFQLIVAVMKAADGGAWSAKGIARAKFAGTPLLRQRALAYVEAEPTAAADYVQSKFAFTKSIRDFVASTLTDEAA